MLSQKMMNFFKTNNVHFEIMNHPRAYSAQRTAQVTHTPGRMVAKPVILQVDNSLKMIVMPADEKIDIMHMMDIFKTKNVRLVNEREFTNVFDDCEIGGMPPLGNLYGIDTFVAKDLTKDETIAFNGGDHYELIRMMYKDFERLVHPGVIA
jgi:Ala-tRNA(Pro) deacylase